MTKHGFDPYFNTLFRETVPVDVDDPSDISPADLSSDSK